MMTKKPLVFVVLISVLTAGGALLAEEYSPPKFEGQIGELSVKNDSADDVTITLWHPSNGLQFASYTIKAGQTPKLIHDDKPLLVGDDWGVQVSGSDIRPISRFAYYDADNRTFVAPIKLLIPSSAVVETRDDGYSDWVQLWSRGNGNLRVKPVNAGTYSLVISDGTRVEHLGELNIPKGSFYYRGSPVKVRIRTGSVGNKFEIDFE